MRPPGPAASSGLAHLLYARPASPNLRPDVLSLGSGVLCETPWHILQIIYDFGLLVQLSDIHDSLHQLSAPQVSRLAAGGALSSILHSFLKNQSRSVRAVPWPPSKSTLSQKRHKSRTHARIRGIYSRRDDWNSPVIGSPWFSQEST